jgi:hypothetical protein
LNNALGRGWRLPALTAAVLLAGVAACSPEPATETDSGGAPAEATAADAIAGVRAALAEHNLGVARERARAAATAHPGDPQVHLLAAQVEARLGNAGDSAAAFLKAMDTGLDTPATHLGDPAFAGVRDSAPFAAIRQRLRPAAPPLASRAKTPAPAPAPRERIRAGDVEIIEDGSGTRIRAGDLVMDTPN